MVLDPGSAGWSFMQDPPEQKITAHQATARLPLAEGLCPECGKPANAPALGITTHVGDPAIADAEPIIYEQIVELFNRVMANREYRPDPSPPPIPSAALQRFWFRVAATLLTDPAKHLGSLGP